MLTTLVLLGAAVLLVGALVILVRIWRTPSMSPSKMTIFAVVAGMLIGITTNVGTYYLLKEADRVADVVTLEPIRVQVPSGQAFTVSGRATIADDRHELWVVVHRPSGGFDIANRSGITVASDGTWVFNPVVAGRPGGQDGTLVYTVSAVIVDVQGAADLREAVTSVPNPDDGVFVGKSRPSGVVVEASVQVTLS